MTLTSGDPARLTAYLEEARAARLELTAQEEAHVRNVYNSFLANSSTTGSLGSIAAIEKKQTVVINRAYLDRFLDSFGGMGDFDDEYIPEDLRSLDALDEESALYIIRKYVIPYYESWNDQAKTEAKLSLSWLFTFNRDDEKQLLIENLFSGQLITFAPPTPAIKMYELIWLEIYGDEQPYLDPNNRYKVKDEGWRLNGITK